MSDRYDRGSSSRRRGVLSHWVPLLLTVTIATAGVAAWAWSQRNRDDEYEDDEDETKTPTGQTLISQPNDLDYDHADYGENPPYGVANSHGPPPRGGPDGAAINLTDVSMASGGPPSIAGWSTRMSGALGTNSTPQQWVGSASKAVSAGVAAASAAVGGALASIREGDKDAYADHETWSEEVDARKERTSSASKSTSGRKRKTVALVVAADSDLDGFDDDSFHEYSSILSYIPRQHDFFRVRIFVLIYAPGLKESSSLDPAGNGQPASLSSSFSNIGVEQAQSQKADDDTPLAVAAPPSGNAAFNAVNAQALALVEKESDIIPFTSSNGHAHILHLLEPDVVYIQESLTGHNGAVINQLQSWMRNEVVVVVGADSGHGGLADSESEAERSASDPAPKWWQREDRVGRGRGVVVVDSQRVNDDWTRRVQGRD
ncbi:hypothetical protein CMQ_7021 [Grosmannia clavigera kw1407]|uniref:Peroxin 22-like protein n=1 Tax=Grosmannia clavigera (strain kw1407 / UAMH 11150) TaxID=655863 RepID=F0X703_GROCL|nr:uncharacterized protein CMQ_7021 [Grosmannia clavigera kw1407]EFX06700.1 hypothetical protein CMQ_7021 [Grosmannia clavigera kw1407]